MGLDQIKVELQNFMGNDRLIANSAWTSSLDYQKKKTRTDEDVVRIINMLADSKHSTPFESVVFYFWITMPIQTDRQHMTHRIASHNGLSGRYRTMPTQWYKVPDDVKGILQKVKMVDYYVNGYEKICEEANNWYINSLEFFKRREKQGDLTNAEYKRLREVFKGILPLNNMTERTTIFNLRSFANYQRLRNSPHAQEEIQQVGRLMLEEVKKHGVCPLAIAALERNGWNI